MKNIEGLAALNLMLDLAQDTERGVVPLSEYKYPKDYGKIIYDDSKPEKDDYYPVVFGGRDDHKAEFSYDSLLAGVTVRCRVTEHPEEYDYEGCRRKADRSCFLIFTAKDEADNSVEFCIEDGHIYYSDLKINNHEI